MAGPQHVMAGCLLCLCLSCVWVQLVKAQCVTSPGVTLTDSVQCTLSSDADFASLPINASTLRLAFSAGHSVTLGGGVLPAMPQLQYLSVDLLEISSIQADAFINLPNLVKLVLINTDIYRPHLEKTLADGAFRGLTGLVDLQADDVGIRTLGADSLSSLPSLDSLHLGNNLLVDLPDGAFTGVGNLTTLSLANNALTALSAGVLQGLSDLQQLDLRHNELTQLEGGAFQDLASLRTLQLSYNSLSSVTGQTVVSEPGVWAGLQGLTTLDLDHNALTSIPAGAFTHLSSLQSLDLNDNQIASIKDYAFSTLPALQFLKLYNNDLKDLTNATFMGLPSLNYLNIHTNELVKLGSLSNIPQLTVLHLQGNQLSELPPDTFLDLPHLSVLTLQDNALATLQEGVFSDLGALSLLDLSQNPWQCGCDLAWLHTWLMGRDPATFQLAHADTTLCAGPNDTQDLQLKDYLDKNYYVCMPTTLAQTTTQATTTQDKATQGPPWIDRSSQIPSAQTGLTTADMANGTIPVMRGQMGDDVRLGILVGSVLLAALLMLCTALGLYCRRRRYAFWKPAPTPTPDPEEANKTQEILTHFSHHRLPIMYMEDAKSVVSQESRESKRSHVSKRSHGSKRSRASKRSKDKFAFDNPVMSVEDSGSVVKGEDQKLEALVLKDAEFGSIVIGRSSTAEHIPDPDEPISIVKGEDHKLEAIILKDAELGNIMVGRGSTAEQLPDDISSSSVASDEDPEHHPELNRPDVIQVIPNGSPAGVNSMGHQDPHHSPRAAGITNPAYEDSETHRNTPAPYNPSPRAESPHFTVELELQPIYHNHTPTDVFHPEPPIYANTQDLGIHPQSEPTTDEVLEPHPESTRNKADLALSVETNVNLEQISGGPAEDKPISPCDNDPNRNSPVSPPESSLLLPPLPRVELSPHPSQCSSSSSSSSSSSGSSSSSSREHSPTRSLADSALESQPTNSSPTPPHFQPIVSSHESNPQSDTTSTKSDKSDNRETSASSSSSVTTSAESLTSIPHPESHRTRANAHPSSVPSLPALPAMVDSLDESHQPDSPSITSSEEQWLGAQYYAQV